jgi:hypothetical protein
MDRQNKIQLLNDIRAGKKSIEVLKKEDLSRYTFLELKILTDILKKPGNSNQARTLTNVLALPLEEAERLFIKHLISVAPNRLPNYGDAPISQADKEVAYSPLSEKLSIYLTHQSLQ